VGGLTPESEPKLERKMLPAVSVFVPWRISWLVMVSETAAGQPKNNHEYMQARYPQGNAKNKVSSPGSPAFGRIETCRTGVLKMNFSDCNHYRYRGPELAVQTIRFSQRLGNPVMGKSLLKINPLFGLFTTRSLELKVHCPVLASPLFNPAFFLF
jgi:hypothetical protein